MKRGVKVLLFIVLAASALLLAGCSKAECKLDGDCTKAGYSSSCIDKKCVRTPIPGACGNGACDAKENECSCPNDCGVCAGSVPGSTLLEKTCTKEKICTIDVPQAKVKPVSITNTVVSQGNQFKITTTFNQPFNLKKDSFQAKLVLDNIANFVSNIRITGYELSAQTKDRQTVILVDKTVSKPLSKDTNVNDDLHLGITSGDLEGTLTNPQLKIDYEYLLTQGSTSQLKTAQILNQLRGVSLVWVLPPVDYSCPSTCDDNNPGTEDTCGAETNYFCEHSPVSGACGNFQCDSNENKCTCASDCGSCSGSAGQYLDMGCNNNICISSLKSGVNPAPVSLYDDRNLNVFHLNNQFTYNKPFNTATDRIKATFTLYNVQEGISSITIESIRALDGSKELGFLSVNRQLNGVGQSFFVDVPITYAEAPESSHFTTLTIAYSYIQNSVLKKGTFSKPLEKITYITPGTV